MRPRRGPTILLSLIGDLKHLELDAFNLLWLERVLLFELDEGLECWALVSGPPREDLELALRGRVWALGRPALVLKRYLDLGFIRRMRAPSKCRIEPPPAATVWICIIGARMRTPATSVSKARSYSPS